MYPVAAVRLRFVHLLISTGNQAVRPFARISEADANADGYAPGGRHSDRFPSERLNPVANAFGGPS